MKYGKKGIKNTSVLTGGVNHGFNFTSAYKWGQSHERTVPNLLRNISD